MISGEVSDPGVVDADGRRRPGEGIDHRAVADWRSLRMSDRRSWKGLGGAELMAGCGHPSGACMTPSPLPFRGSQTGIRRMGREA
jgi:hypothetical protein